MQGSKKVLSHLQQLLNSELAARDQYFAHSEMYKDWGLDKFHQRLCHEMEEEIEHAQRIIERMLFLETTPDFNQKYKVNVGKDVKQMLQNDLATEYAVTAELKAAILVCENEQDYETRQILTQLLDDTEMDHAYWLEQQLRLIDMVGLKNFIQSQMTADSQE